MERDGKKWFREKWLLRLEGWNDTITMLTTKDKLRIGLIYMVSFTSLEFLFRFFPAFLAVYYITPARYRNTALLLGSIAFYAMGEPYYVPLLLAAVWLNYFFARKIYSCRNTRRGIKCRKDRLVAVLVLDVGLLAAFKAVGVFLDGSILPLGLSFYLFKMISFQVDIFRKEMTELPTFKRTAVYFTMFPQIVSGPIMRFHEGSFSVGKRECSLEKLEEGMQYFVAGLGTKALLADRLAILWKDIHVIGYESISTPLAWLGAAAYSMELYFDFWGYSLMASGICVMLGFPFIKNFDHPYASKSISEFWRRWHMTLGSFFRDYVYIPLGGSREGLANTVRNLLIVWLLTGLWHGGGLNFLLWGLVLFLLIAAEKLALGRAFEKVPLAGRFFTLLFIPVTWVFFAVTDLGQLYLYLGRLFPFMGVGETLNSSDIWKYLGMYWHYLLLGAIWCIPAVSRFLQKHRKHPAVVVMTVLAFWLSIYCIVSMESNPFAYLKF